MLLQTNFPKNGVMGDSTKADADKGKKNLGNDDCSSGRTFGRPQTNDSG
jgi:hypothetical protein